MGIPDNYKVLFLQGGASQQFSAVPMNLMKNKKAAYIITGQWAKKAYQEAQKYGEAVAVASSADKTFSYIPDCSDLVLYSYLYRENRNRGYPPHQSGSTGVVWRMGHRKSLQRFNPLHDPSSPETMDSRSWNQKTYNIPLLSSFIRRHPNLFRHRHLHSIEDANA